MPIFECACGFSCGSAKAWTRHESRFPGSTEHRLLDELLLELVRPEKTDESSNVSNKLALPTKQHHFSLDELSVSKSLEHETSPLISACRRGDSEKLTLLLGTSPPATDLARCDAAGMSAMAWAAKTGRCDMIRALLDAGASPNPAEQDSEALEAQPPLYLALTKARFDAAALLLEAHARPCEPEPVRRQTALHAACTTDAPLLLVELLLAALARSAAEDQRLEDIDDVDYGAAGAVALPADSEGCTPLHAAASGGRIECARALLRATCAAHELRRVSSRHVTPLAAACRRGHAEMALCLVSAEFGAPLDASAVHLCLTKGHSELLEALAAAAAAGGIDDRRPADGASALMLAAEAGEEAAIATLLGLGADAGASDDDGHTALMRAAFYGHAKAVGLLLGAGCAVDAVDREGSSALHHAGRGAQEWVFDLLEMRHGADSELKNAKGEVPTVQAEPCRMQ